MEVKLNKDLTVKKGDYLKVKNRNTFIRITEITENKSQQLGDVKQITYTHFDLENLTQFQTINRQEFQFKNQFKTAEKITTTEADTLWQQAHQPMPKQEQEALMQSFKASIKREDYFSSETILQDYFRKVIIREPKKVRIFFELRALIGHKRHRPCFCTDHLQIETLANFYQKLDTHIWDLIPEKLKSKPRKITNRSDYQADPEDKHLQNLVAPFVKSDSLHLSMMGVNFDDYGITATNAHLLLFLPKVKAGKKGVYCMTRKCFKENGEMGLVEISYPKYRAILPDKEHNYEPFDIEIDTFRKIISTLDANGFAKDKNYLPFHFRYGKEGYAMFDGIKKLLPALETFSKLGENKIKLWLSAPNKAAILTPTNIDSTTLHKTDFPMVLVMPMLAADSWKEYQKKIFVGAPSYNLDSHELSFSGSPAKPIPFKTKAKANKFKIAKLRALAQKQQIRLLELERAA